MAVLILDTTGANITVKCTQAAKNADTLIGETSRAFAGNSRNSIRGRKKSRMVVANLLTTAQEAAIQAAILNGAQITCNGDVLDSVATICEVYCTNSKMMNNITDQWEMSLSVFEV